MEKKEMLLTTWYSYFQTTIWKWQSLQHTSAKQEMTTAVHLSQLNSSVAASLNFDLGSTFVIIVGKMHIERRSLFLDQL